MKSHKFVDFKLKVLTSHNNQKVSCSTTVLDLHSHLLWVRFTIQFSGCLVILDWSPCSDLAQPLLYSLRTKQQISLCDKMTWPRDTLAGKTLASMTRLKLHSSWLFFRRCMLIWLTHLFLICTISTPFFCKKIFEKFDVDIFPEEWSLCMVSILALTRYGHEGSKIGALPGQRHTGTLFSNQYTQNTFVK